jgi:glycerophosphoryl diester phosphodiesterase
MLRYSLLLIHQAIFILLTLAACTTTKKAKLTHSFPDFYKEGHRGARGLMPENTIPSMILAIDHGANVIEVDVYLSKDGKVVIAHDPYINIDYTQLKDGQQISKDDAKKYVWHQMDYSEIRKLDVGSKFYNAFPQQKKLVAYMPLLEELIDSVESYTRANHLPGIIYNIELKTSPRYEGLGYNAPYEKVVDAVMDVVKSKNIGSRFYMQSFDIRPLKYIHEKYAQVPIGLLIDAKKKPEEALNELGFVPDIFSPHYSLVTKDLAVWCNKQKMKLVPWTVNSLQEMQTLITLGVNGIITDFPNLLSQIK